MCHYYFFVAFRLVEAREWGNILSVVWKSQCTSNSSADMLVTFDLPCHELTNLHTSLNHWFSSHIEVMVSQASSTALSKLLFTAINTSLYVIGTSNGNRIQTQYIFQPYWCILYSRKLWQGFNLVNWRFCGKLPNLKSVNINSCSIALCRTACNCQI